MEAKLASGQSHELVGELRQLVSEHPLRERLWGQLMVALYRCGRQGEALRSFADLRRILSEELGLEPSPGLRQLEQDVLNQRSSLDGPLAPAPAQADGGGPEGPSCRAALEDERPPASWPQGGARCPRPVLGAGPSGTATVRPGEWRTRYRQVPARHRLRRRRPRRRGDRAVRPLRGRAGRALPAVHRGLATLCAHLPGARALRVRGHPWQRGRSGRPGTGPSRPQSSSAAPGRPGHREVPAVRGGGVRPRRRRRRTSRGPRTRRPPLGERTHAAAAQASLEGDTADGAPRNRHLPRERVGRGPSTLEAARRLVARTGRRAPSPRGFERRGGRDTGGRCGGRHPRRQWDEHGRGHRPGDRREPLLRHRDGPSLGGDRGGAPKRGRLDVRPGGLRIRPARKRA